MGEGNDLTNCRKYVACTVTALLTLWFLATSIKTGGLSSVLIRPSTLCLYPKTKNLADGHRFQVVEKIQAESCLEKIISSDASELGRITGIVVKPQKRTIWER